MDITDQGAQMEPLLPTVTTPFSSVARKSVRNEEEAVLDRGGTRSMLKANFEQEELEDHRTLYIGVHVPTGRRSHRRHGHGHHGHRHRKRSKERDPILAEGRESPSNDTPSQRVQFLLGTEDDDEEHLPHDLFTELDEICLRQGEEAEWRETARWLKFEEDVEDGGERWSKPYVATLSLHSLFELRSCILNGTVLLDMRAGSLEEVIDMVLDQQETVSPLGERRRVREALLLQHHHQNQKKLANRIPIVRSFADMGRKQPEEPHGTDKNAGGPSLCPVRSSVWGRVMASDIQVAFCSPWICCPQRTSISSPLPPSSTHPPPAPPPPRSYSITREGNSITREGYTITREGYTITREGYTITREGNTITREGNTITREGNTITREGYTITREGYTITTEGYSITREGYTITTEGYTITREGNTITREGYTITREGNTITREGYTITREGYTITREGYTITREGYTITREGNTITREGNTITRGGYSITREGYSITREGYTITREGNSITREGYSITREGNSITREGYTITREGNTITRGGNSITREGYTITREGNSITREGNTITREGYSITREGYSITREGYTITREGYSITREGNSITREGYSITREGNTITREGYSITREGYTITREGYSITREGNSITREGNTITREGYTITREGYTITREGQLVSPQSLLPVPTEGKGDVSRENSAVDFSKIDLHFMKKIPPGAEASNVLVGELEFLEKPVVAFVRLSPAVLLNGLAEVPIATRFLFILLGPLGKGPQYHEIGRSIATLMTDEGLPDSSHPSVCRVFGGLLMDIKRKAPHYLSDYTDAVSLQCLASFLFLYCACMSPVITFGGLLGEATEGRISAIESLFGASMTGMAYSLCAGQPLTILGSTGPVLVFEKILFKFCKENGLSYLSLRACIGLWTAFLCLLLVATDASSLVCYITRFTEEAFASLICLIFIYEALEKLIHLGEHYPINMNNNLQKLTQYSCSCMEPPDPSNATLQYWDDNNITASEIYWEAMEVKDCIKNKGEFVGSACGPHGPYVPDVCFWSVVLFFSTVAMSAFLKDFKFSRYFPTKVRSIISDFAVFITILTMVVGDYALGIPSPKLQVPSVFKPTRDDRGWFISPLGSNPWWTAIVTVIPALLCTILIFMDQQITAVIINRKEHKLKKGCGYHLDLFVVGVMLGVCSLMGLPWFVAATVLSISHVNSLKLESECSAPGEQPRFLGILEQRFTGLMIFLLMGCSVFMTSVLKFIPMPVLYGVFLYMGASSLKGIQFFDRLKLFGMPAKHQPDFIYLRHVPLRKVHLFTIIQLTCLALLWIIKTSKAAIVFPMMVLALVFIRKLMDLFFTKREMSWLDDLMPESRKKKLEDAEEEDEERSILGEHEGVVQMPLEDYPPKGESAEINLTDELSKASFGNTWNVTNSKTD
ncbi:sodium-driven chloride bicarbonate exchanger [Osmerus eperlanus]|uniref:sodium-driven chloride bicarbonate exchanger n=1 Tax=Osmerus eperlanus TaxID=29151 RepID=UPI002E110A6F